MSETKLTAEELDALEKAASYYLESGWEMPVDTKDLLSLIAAARELEELRSCTARANVLEVGSAPNGTVEVVLNCTKKQSAGWAGLLYKSVTVVPSPPEKR